MAIDQVDRTVVTEEPAPTVAGRETVQTDSRRVTRTGPGGAEMGRRIVVLVFGLIQIVIGARIVLREIRSSPQGRGHRRISGRCGDGPMMPGWPPCRP